MFWLRFLEIFLTVSCFVVLMVGFILYMMGNLRPCPKCKSRLTLCSSGWVILVGEKSYVCDIDCKKCKTVSRQELPHDQWPRTNKESASLAGDVDRVGYDPEAGRIRTVIGKDGGRGTRVLD